MASIYTASFSSDDLEWRVERHPTDGTWSLFGRHAERTNSLHVCGLSTTSLLQLSYELVEGLAPVIAGHSPARGETAHAGAAAGEPGEDGEPVVLVFGDQDDIDAFMAAQQAPPNG